MKTYIHDPLRRPFAAPARTLNKRQPRKPRQKALFAPVLVAVLSLLSASQVLAQTFTTLHSFTATSTNSSGAYTNSDGVGPGGLVLSGNTLYGTGNRGGSGGAGTVFAVDTDGRGFRLLHSFTALPDVNSGTGTNCDGAYPQELLVSGNTVYGTAASGGGFGFGTVFKLDTNGTGFAILHSFTAISYPYTTNSDGAGPGGLILSGSTLYGTASAGGISGGGTLFAVNTDGTGFANLHERGRAWVEPLPRSAGCVDSPMPVDRLPSQRCVRQCRVKPQFLRVIPNPAPGWQQIEMCHSLLPHSSSAHATCHALLPHFGPRSQIAHRTSHFVPSAAETKFNSNLKIRSLNTL